MGFSESSSPASTFATASSKLKLCCFAIALSRDRLCSGNTHLSSLSTATSLGSDAVISRDHACIVMCNENAQMTKSWRLHRCHHASTSLCWQLSTLVPLHSCTEPLLVGRVNRRSATYGRSTAGKLSSQLTHPASESGGGGLTRRQNMINNLHHQAQHHLCDLYDLQPQHADGS